MAIARQVYWWSGVPNFGDTLTHTLLNALGVDHFKSDPASSNLVMTGSILEHLPSGWAGTILGAGKLHESSDLRIRLRRADIVALRGPLTAKGLRGDFVLGDPGLLASHVLTARPKVKHNLGVVRHWQDSKLPKRFAHGRQISPTSGARWVVGEIASCKQIVTSSLHGCIVADALGIPRYAEPFDSEFKWRDYAAAIGEDPHFYELHSPARPLIERRQKELYEAVQATLFA